VVEKEVRLQRIIENIGGENTMDLYHSFRKIGYRGPDIVCTIIIPDAQEEEVRES
jgi:hypothetical protein